MTIEKNNLRNKLNSIKNNLSDLLSGSYFSAKNCLFSLLQFGFLHEDILKDINNINNNINKLMNSKKETNNYITDIVIDNINNSLPQLYKNVQCLYHLGIEIFKKKDEIYNRLNSLYKSVN